MRSTRPVTAAIATVAIALVSALSVGAGHAQEEAPKPQAYKPVAIQLPQPVSDPSFGAFRKQIAEIAQRKDRAALAKLVASEFFWIADEGKDIAQKNTSGIDNVVRALYLDNPDTEGWDILATFAADPTGDPLPQRQGVICAPGEPKYDGKAATALYQQTSTTPVFWYYPTRDGLEVRSGLTPDSKVTGKIGLHLVWVNPDESPAAAVHTETTRIVLPSGQLGYVASDALMPLPGDLLCYRKEGNAWRIAGFFGGMPPEK